MDVIDRDKEAETQNRLIDAMSERVQEGIASEIARESAALVSQFEVTRGIPSPTQEHEGQMQALILDAITLAISTFGARVVAQGVETFPPYTTDGGATFTFPTKATAPAWEVKSFSEFFQRIAQEYIQAEAMRQRIAGITKTTRDIIIRQIVSGQNNGLSIAEIAKSITDSIPAMSRWRAATIARTETHGAANFGAAQSAKASDLPMVKEWISVHDSRTRDFGAGDGVVDEYNHRAMDGQTVPEDQPFLMPWSKGDDLKINYAGDPDAPPAAVINCRCAVAHFVDEDAAFG